jgi:hypothetical protein
VRELNQPGWVWEKTDVRHSGSSGDIAKLFKNEAISHPGVLAKGKPSDEAILAAREIIQNSWDAARELQAELGKQGIAPPNFEMDFAFAEHVRADKVDLAAALDLAGLKRQLDLISDTGPGARAKIGLRPTSCLDEIVDEVVPLRTLKVTERGTTGMYGAFSEARSKLYLALISIGYTQKAEGSGGSYGYGKAGLVGVSSTRTVVAYTCFKERADDPGVTRRLIGMTYWGQHEVGTSHTGFARFGRFEDGWTQPFENEEADEIAQRLGIDSRNPAVLDDLGTTFLLVDPVVAPTELVTAIERNWWPAIFDGAFSPTVSIQGASGVVEQIDVQPMRDPVIKSFIRAYELTMMSQDNAIPTEVARDLGNAPRDADSLKLGKLGLLAKPDGWSYSQIDPVEEEPESEEGSDADGVEEVSRSSLIALVRGPRMVVQYLECSPGKTPFIRGVFVADEEVDDLLRQTEPKAHDLWRTTGVEEGIDVRGPIVANSVVKKIKSEVREFQKRLKPPIPDPGDVNLPVFQELFRKLMTGIGPPPPPPPPPPGERDVVAKFVRQILKPSPKGDAVFLEAEVSFRLSESFSGGEAAFASVSLHYSFIEDGRKGEGCPAMVVAPAHFVEVTPGFFEGELSRDPVSFLITSEPYSSDWTGRITAAGNLGQVSAGGAL